VDVEEPDYALDELQSLVEAAGGMVCGRSFQRRRKGAGWANPKTFVGKGKAAEIGELVKAHEAKLVVFDNELSPAQIRELEKIVGTKVIDRSELILDIFASRARTKEAKLQVELAQLEYTAPRLRGMWSHLERQVGVGGGGAMSIGMRGPGEKQIEIDRRIVKKKIDELKSELKTIHQRREREVKERALSTYTVGLVGYTNAGKSTLMNALTGAGTYVADQLFATLDTKTRRWRVKPGAEVMLSDTVGFVRKLPHHLVASFRTTLEETLNAHLLLHVIDVSHPQVREQIAAVEEVLRDLEGDLSRVVPVLNKIDRITDRAHLHELELSMPNSVSISAATGEGIDKLADLVVARRRENWARLAVRGPAGDGKLQSLIRGRALILEERYEDDHWIVEIELARAEIPHIQKLRDVTIEER
jgi:GTP-binding protein HflX